MTNRKERKRQEAVEKRSESPGFSAPERGTPIAHTGRPKGQGRKGKRHRD